MGLSHRERSQGRAAMHGREVGRLGGGMGPPLVPHFINTTTFAARDFWPRRGASDEHTLQRSVRSEQRRLGQKEPPPGGLRRFSVLASLLLGHSPTAGDAPSSRLARTENRRNKRGCIYETGYLGQSQERACPFPAKFGLSASFATGRAVAYAVSGALLTRVIPTRKAGQARIPLTTSPWMSVRRKSRPWKR